MQWKYTSANTKQHVCRKCTNNAADPWFTLHPLALAALSVGHITDSPLYMRAAAGLRRIAGYGYTMVWACSHTC